MFGMAALALFGALLHHHGEVRVKHYQLKHWLIEVRSDQFTGKTVCTMDNHDIAYDHGVVTFSFHHRVDTADAVYRIDHGPLQRAVLVAPEAAALGARLGTDNPTNPSDGRVPIPAAYLKTAASIAIKPNTHAQSRAFALNGFGDALAAIKGQGCDVG
jgi:hypothetical protein